MQRYSLFPPLARHLSETFNYSGGADYRKIEIFYRKHGYIPFLRIGERELAKAYSFYLSHLPEGAVPVVLGLRQTKWDVERNADEAVWLSFIDKCRKEFPDITFVAVGLKDEVFAGIEPRRNLIIAKDFGTSINEDLALIRSSFLFMATESGVTTIAMFSDLPYLIFQVPSRSMHINLGLETGERLCYQTDTQKRFDSTITVTPKVLVREFKKIHGKLDKQAWLKRAMADAKPNYSHPGNRLVGM